jgi:DNA-binding transcriptional ArsR family regulator
VRPRRDGRMVFYTLDDRHIVSLFRQTLRHVQEAKFRREARPRRGGNPLGLPASRTAGRAR